MARTDKQLNHRIPAEVHDGIDAVHRQVKETMPGVSKTSVIIALLNHGFAEFRKGRVAFTRGHQSVIEENDNLRDRVAALEEALAQKSS